MAFKSRLRTEVILNVSIVVGAALLFGGFLLLKLAEKELVQERVAGITSQVHLLASAVQGRGGNGQVELEQAGELLRRLPADVAPETWRIIGPNAEIYASLGSPRHDALDLKALRLARFSNQPVVVVDYPSAFLPFARQAPSRVEVTTGLFSSDRSVGAIQAFYSLSDIRKRMSSARRFLLVYVFCYGAVLVGFGAFLLERNVIAPVRQLLHMTQRVSAGEFREPVPVTGPGEIAELATSFNRMLEALERSRTETAAHIRSLETANQELKQARLQLSRSERMASVGHLAAGMAHEIGNPLGAIMGYLGYLKAELEIPGHADLIQRALEESGRIDRLVRDLLDFSAPSTGREDLVDPADVLAETARLLETQGKFAGIRLQEDYPKSLPKVRIARHKLLQVLVNLILNARDALSEGGDITLSGGADAGTVWVSVADSGEGISPDTLPHVFDPFFSTKPEGQGRGLGLSICHRVIEEAGGHIEVESEIAHGSVFIVNLPGEGGDDGL